MKIKMTYSYLSFALFFSISAYSGTEKSAPTVEAAKAATPAAVAPAGKDLSIKDGTIEFFAIGKPSMLKIHGESTKMTGTMNRNGNKLSGKLEIPLESFETGMSVRNSHLKEKVFETSKYEKAKLSIDSLVLPDGTASEVKNIPFTGKLSFHGVEKDISGTATVKPADALVAFDAEFNIKMSDFQITPPEFMGMSIKDDVKVDAKGEAKLSI